MEAFSLLEVNEYIKRVLALNFEEPFWVECEINQVSQSRGNHYLQLIQKAEDSDEVLAMNSGTIWYRQFLFIKKKLGELTNSILQDGIKVKLKVNVNFNERYGLSLNIEDIDPSYTFGQYELNRQKIIEKLTQKELIDKNSSLPMPSVIQKVAVISSNTAAGFKDFAEHLENNPYGYAFLLKLYQAAMQGQNTEKEVVEALRAAKKEDYNLIVIIRGGGSKLDLSSFDNYNIAFEIATSEIPVITGIGHEIDLTVTDLVAHTKLKTPTAVADWIIEYNLDFESSLIELQSSINWEVQEVLNYQNVQLSLIEERLKSIPKLRVALAKQALVQFDLQIEKSLSLFLNNKQKELIELEAIMGLLDPKNILKRGYCLFFQNNKAITRKSKVNLSQDAAIQFEDGELNLKLN